MMLYVVLDIIIAAIAVSIIYRCVRDGFVKTFLKMFKVLIAIVLAFVFASRLAVPIKDRFIEGQIAQGVSSTVSSALMGAGVDDSPERVDEIFPKVVITLAESAGIDLQNVVIDPIKNAVRSGGEGIADAITNVLVEPIATGLSTVIAFVLIFISALIAISLLIVALDTLCKLPVLHAANKVLGFFFGVVYAVLESWALARVIVYLLVLVSTFHVKWLMGFDYENTFLLRFFYHLHPLSWLGIG